MKEKKSHSSLCFSISNSVSVHVILLLPRKSFFMDRFSFFEDDVYNGWRTFFNVSLTRYPCHALLIEMWSLLRPTKTTGLLSHKTFSWSAFVRWYSDMIPFSFLNKSCDDRNVLRGRTVWEVLNINQVFRDFRSFILVYLGWWCPFSLPHVLHLLRLYCYLLLSCQWINALTVGFIISFHVSPFMIWW
jgi:hypothetical protein